MKRFCLAVLLVGLVAVHGPTDVRAACGGCITDAPDACKNVEDGDYQSCSSCEYYTSCKDQQTWIKRPCPISEVTGKRTQWLITSRTQGYCTDQSNTCNNCGPPTVTPSPYPPTTTATTPARPTCTTTGANCISATTSCVGLPDGDYQACEACTIYHSCSGGVNWSNRDCPLTNQGGLRGRLVWVQISRNQGYCDYQSSTCAECGGQTTSISNPTTTPKPCQSTGSTCLTASPDACKSKADGDYQACEGCTFYHSCSGGVNWSNRPCPLTNYGGLRGKLVWQQFSANSGICDYSSTTCHECGTPPTPTQTTPSTGTCTSTGKFCITASEFSCRSLADGHYQACESCTIYHSCSGGVNWANRECPLTNQGGIRGHLVWKQLSSTDGICDYSSDTCTECATTTVGPTPSTCTSTGPGCITSSSTSCVNRADGDYQACEACTIYHSCSGGVNWANRPCPITNYGGLRGQLVWVQLQSNKGICDYQSSTCSECYTTTTRAPTTTTTTVKTTTPPAKCTATGEFCISAATSCKNLADGDYQACEGCTFYHSCSGGVNWSNRPCPLTNQGGINGRLVWVRRTDNSGICDYYSSTCTECYNGATRTPTPAVTTTTVAPTTTLPPVICSSTGVNCITSTSKYCSSLPDGDYQACESCTYYHSCSGGVLWPNRPCPLTNQGGIRGRLVWKQLTKSQGICDYSSTTCSECSSVSPTAPATPTPNPPSTTSSGQTPSQCVSTGDLCISATTSCKNLADGDYQACEGCTFYHSCSGGVNWSKRPCPLTNQGGLRGRLVWVRWTDNSGICDYYSSTCTECANVPTRTPTTPKTTTPAPTTSTTPSHVCQATGINCITATSTYCSSLPNGDYQACESCTIYHSCSGGVLWPNRPCPLTNYGGIRGRLVWRQLSKSQGICDYTSNTCKECDNVTPTSPITTPRPIVTTTVTPSCTNNGATGDFCITRSSTSCKGRLDGDYQACEGCTFYHSCSGGVIWPDRPCPLTNQGGLNGRLVWVRRSDNSGICDYRSSTCNECYQGTTRTTTATTTISTTRATTTTPPPAQCTSTGLNCITSTSKYCSSLPNGDYQACESCTIYHSCSGGVLWPNRPCPLTTQGGLRGHLVWKQLTKTAGICDYSSNTCKECDTVGPTVPSPITTTPVPTTSVPVDPWPPCRSTGAGCITGFKTSCQGRADGHYQACEGCTIYHSCSGGVIYPSRSCALTNQGGLHGRLVWRQLTPTAGICDYTSSTCKECVDTPVPTEPTPDCPPNLRCVEDTDTTCKDKNLPDGDYQACFSCNHYLSCSKNQTWRARPCPVINGVLTQWRITSLTQGYCTEGSETCNECEYTGPSSLRRRTCSTATATGATCLWKTNLSCGANGDYQACERCDAYHTCSNGILYPDRPCPAGLVWQSTSARSGYCTWKSSTCKTC